MTVNIFLDPLAIATQGTFALSEFGPPRPPSTGGVLKAVKTSTVKKAVKISTTKDFAQCSAYSEA